MIINEPEIINVKESVLICESISIIMAKVHHMGGFNLTILCHYYEFR